MPPEASHPAPANTLDRSPQPQSKGEQAVVSKKTTETPPTSRVPGEIVIVARSSMNIESEHITPQVKPDLRQEQSTPEPTRVQSAEIPQEKTQEKPHFTARSKPLHFLTAGSSLPLNIVGKIVAWIMALPTAFFFVVIAPRLLGKGFHATDFVDVITMQGIGRYKIVVTLILAWSLVTVVFVLIYQEILKRIFHRRVRAAGA